MPNKNSDNSYFPPKPKNAADFKPPVSWLGGRELVASLKGIIMYSVYGETIDPRSWMKANIYPNVEEAAEDQYDQPTAEDKTDSVQKQEDPVTKKKIKNAVEVFWLKKVEDAWDWKKKYFEYWKAKYSDRTPGVENGELTEFWFDYIADSGDGQTGVYGVGCLGYSDLWIEGLPEDSGDIGHAEILKNAVVSFDPKDEKFKKGDQISLLPRGSFLFVGGDTAYHVADFATIHERFQNPLRWAFASVRKFLAVKYRLDVKNVCGTNAQGVGIEPDLKPAEEWDGMLAGDSKEAPFNFWDTEPPRPLFGVPANHDYYDDIDGFNRQFRRPPYENLQENAIDERYRGGFPLALPSFQREQEASYIALRLPFDWWFLGIDSENEKLDFRQKIFFEQVMKNYRPKKLILATPEPTTVFGLECNPESKTSIYLAQITGSLGFEQPFLKGGEFVALSSTEDDSTPPEIENGKYCRLDLSGDVHHYARYWGPEPQESKKSIPAESENPKFSSKHYASLVAGGGGAFFDSTGTLIGRAEVKKSGESIKVAGDIPPQITFPSPTESTNAIADRIFDLRNIREGGYVQSAGAIIAIILYYSLAYAASVHDFFFREFVSTQTNTSGLYGGAALFLSAGLLVGSAYLLHRLINRLKDIRSGKASAEIRKKYQGRISELLLPFCLLAAGSILYFVLIAGLKIFGRDISPATESSFGQSLLLLLNLIIGCLLGWISIEYTNWLPLRFKFLSNEGLKEYARAANVKDGQEAGTADQKPNRKDGKTGKSRIDTLPQDRKWFDTKAVENVPTLILSVTAAAVVILGISIFGSQPLLEVGINILFTLTAIGVFGGLIALAVSVGAAYQKKWGVRGFYLIGFFHAVFQILTPFVLVYYGSWWFVLGFFLVTIVTNGYIIKRLTGGILPPLGSWFMKHCRAGSLFAVWILYGLAVIVPPFFLPKDVGITEFFVRLIGMYKSFASPYFPMVISLAIAGYLGHRLSRVWFSWYLAVSLAFNGHNNESGGAARIEDFKHILRIRVEREKLTVYVIGFDQAKPNLEKLEPKLVDFFELTCQEFSKPSAVGKDSGD